MLIINSITIYIFRIYIKFHWLILVVGAKFISWANKFCSTPSSIWPAYMLRNVAAEIVMLANFQILCCWPTHLVRLEMAVKRHRLIWLNHKFYGQQVFFHYGNSVDFAEMWHIRFIKTNMDDGIAFILCPSNNYPFCPWIKKETVKLYVSGIKSPHAKYIFLTYTIQ